MQMFLKIYMVQQKNKFLKIYKKVIMYFLILIGRALNRYEGGHLARTPSTLQVQSGLAFTANDLSRTAVRNAEGVSPVCSRNMRLK